jgi:phosphoglycolate phosphatase
MPHPRRLVIFDLDGTLVDSLADIAHHLRRTMVAFGMPEPSDEQTRAWVGGGAKDLIARAANVVGVERLPDQQFLDDMHAAFISEYRRQPMIQTALYSGIAECLDELSANGTMLAVLSNKPHDLTVEISRQLLHRWTWHSIVGLREGFAKKPDPTGALEIATAANLAPSESTFVGDSDVDIATGRAAGMRTVGVTWGIGLPDALINAGPDIVCSSTTDLARIIQS